MKLIINQELKELIPKLQQEEYQLLEKSIIEEGCRDSIIVWDNTIIDGHNRYEICTKNNIPFKTQEMDFENIGQVKNWMIKNQLARRNLTDSQRRYFIGKRYEEEKRTITNEKGINQHKEVVVQNEPQAKERTSEKIAQENNINESTVRRNAEYSKAIDKIKEHQPEVAEKILNEEISISRKDVVEISKIEPQERTPVIDLFNKGEARKVEEAKKILSPDEEWLKEEYKKIDKEHDNHKLVASLINEVKFRKIDEEAVADYMKLAIDVFQEEFIKNCDRLIDKLNEMKAYHSNITKIRRIK